MDGLYRLDKGGEIYRSSYNFDTQSIGPYKSPIDFVYDTKRCTTSSMSWWYLYLMLHDYSDAVAVFNLNNVMMVVLTPEMTFQKHYAGEDRKHNALMWNKGVIGYEPLTHIGYVKTYTEYKTVFTYPYRLFMDKTGELIGADNIQLPSGFKPVINPPMAIYKKLLDTSNRVVLQDSDSGDILLI